MEATITPDQSPPSTTPRRISPSVVLNDTWTLSYVTKHNCPKSFVSDTIEGRGWEDSRDDNDMTLPKETYFADTTWGASWSALCQALVAARSRAEACC